VVVAAVAVLSCSHASDAMPTIEVIFSGSEKPRGVVVGPAGDLFVTESSGLTIICARLLMDAAIPPPEII
jgi:hypothetical protein